MHELSLCQQLCDQLLDLARQEGAHCVHQVELEIGVLCCVEPEALRFCFEAMAKSGPLAATRLRVSRAVAQAECQACGCQYEVKDWLSVCPGCGQRWRHLAGGDAILIKAVEVS